MIKSRRMKKVEIIGPKSELNNVVNELYGLKSLHIIDYSCPEGEEVFDIGNSIPEGEEFAELLVKIRSLIAHLDLKQPEVVETPKIAHITKKVEKLYSEMNHSKHREMYLSRILEIYGDEDETILQAAKRLEKIPNCTNGYFAGVVSKDISSELKEVGLKSVVMSYKDVYPIVIFARDDAEITTAKKMLAGVDFFSFESQTITEFINGLKGTNLSSLSDYEKQKEIAERELKKIKTRYLEISEKFTPFLFGAKTVIESEVNRCEGPLKFAVSEHTFLVTGWSPVTEVKALKRNILSATKNKVIINTNTPEKDEDVPVALTHSRIVRPFEFFMNLYSLPKYGEIDPTFMLSLTFPLFFGFMLGDFGYGLVLLLIFTQLKKKMPNSRDLLDSMLISSISAIFFGLLFGEFFGFEELFGFKLWHIMSRAHSVQTLLVISVIVGVIHVNIGFIIGFINELRSHGFIHAMNSKLSWMLLELGLVLFYLSFSGMLEISVFIGLILVVISIMMLFLSEGFIAILELPSLLSNIMSYTRLMAVGLASVSLAFVANDLAFKMPRTFSGIVAGIIIFVFFHTLNMALGVLGPFLHSLRLHYVELFTKFFKGGGKQYNPFGEK